MIDIRISLSFSPPFVVFKHPRHKNIIYFFLDVEKFNISMTVYTLSCFKHTLRTEDEKWI